MSERTQVITFKLTHMQTSECSVFSCLLAADNRFKLSAQSFQSKRTKPDLLSPYTNIYFPSEGVFHHDKLMKFALPCHPDLGKFGSGNAKQASAVCFVLTC